MVGSLLCEDLNDAPKLLRSLGTPVSDASFCLTSLICIFFFVEMVLMIVCVVHNVYSSSPKGKVSR